MNGFHNLLYLMCKCASCLSMEMCLFQQESIEMKRRDRGKASRRGSSNRRGPTSLHGGQGKAVCGSPDEDTSDVVQMSRMTLDSSEDEEGSSYFYFFTFILVLVIDLIGFYELN